VPQGYCCRQELLDLGEGARQRLHDLAELLRDAAPQQVTQSAGRQDQADRTDRQRPAVAQSGVPAQPVGQRVQEHGEQHTGERLQQYLHAAPQEVRDREQDEGDQHRHDRTAREVGEVWPARALLVVVGTAGPEAVGSGCVA
jgi:hypothetical protein